MPARARVLQVLAVSAAAIGLAVPSASAGAPTSSPTLGTAAGYSVLAGSTVTNTGPSVLSGELGVSPGSAITGFPPGLAHGATHAADAAALQAQNDLTIAYNDAASAKTTTTVPDVGDIGGETLTPGVYTSASSMMLTGTVTLNGQGNPNAIFIFQAGSTVVTASSSRVVLENGAQACNVYWQVGSSATLGTASSFVGTLMALTSATVTTGVTVDGRVLARNGAVTLDSDTFLPTSCTTTVTPTPVTTTTTSSSTSTSTSTSTSGKGTGGGTSPSTTTTTTTTTTKPVKPTSIALPTSGCGCGSTQIGGGGGSKVTGSGKRYTVIAVSKYTKISIDQKTGHLKFMVAKGHYGVFTCDVQYGNKVIVVHYTVAKSKTGPAACVAAA
jgi:hypothetical protein